ncbi:MAG: hypothetical protein FJZ43_02940 [Candidatus Staskawiczbacteria bacterium]|nr:hypothetical protein [Candidatus Staskawiczbacteria bacterium]
MNKKYLLYISIPAIALSTAGIVAVGSVSADSVNKQSSGISSLVNAIAQKFNLNQAEVQQVFDDHKSQMMLHMEEKRGARLNQAVVDGKLTQDQVNKILAKQAELKAQEASFKASLEGKTKEEIKALVKAQADSIKQWAEENDIPIKYLAFGGFGKHRGMGFGFGHFIRK